MDIPLMLDIAPAWALSKAANNESCGTSKIGTRLGDHPVENNCFRKQKRQGDVVPSIPDERNWDLVSIWPYGAGERGRNKTIRGTGT